MEGAATSAEEARTRGNDLYKQGKLKDAEAAFEQAASLAPDDPAPLSNLSSVQFELGNYDEAARLIKRSLALTKDVPGDEAADRKKQMLYARLGKCYMHDSKFEEAREVVEQVTDNELKAALGATIDVLAAWRSSSSSRDQATHRGLVFDRIPRFKPYLEDVPEYYAIGHDEADGLVDEQMLKALSSSDGTDTLSFLLCGSGDGRHLFSTILTLCGTLEKFQGKELFKSAHFTMLDLKPAAIARTLIFIDMMTLYTLMKFQRVPGVEDATTVMAYLYFGQVIPPAVNAKLQECIKQILPLVESDGEIFQWFFMDVSTRKQVAHVLKQWQQPMPYGPKPIRRVVRKRLQETRKRREAFMGPGQLEKTPERKTWEELTVMLPPKAFAKNREPQLVPLVEKYYKGSKSAAKELDEYIDATWVTNPTMIDVDYLKSSRKDLVGFGPRSDEVDVPAVECDPLEESQKLIPSKNRSSMSTGALDYTAKFFDMVALSFMRITGRLKLEALVGEMTDTLERLQWNCLETRSQPVGGIDPAQFPRTYDRIHMSNIPDYVGGLFTVAMHGRPVLDKPLKSSLKYTVLLNPPLFTNREHFQAEHLLMYGNSRIADHFFLLQQPKERHPRDDDIERLMGPLAAFGPGGFMSENYQTWDAQPVQKLPMQRRLSRPALEKWLYAHFLKICLPHPRPRSSQAPVHAPLNLTAFLRLVAHLAQVGYPAHWLAGLLTELCHPKGDITTTARPPRKMVTDQADVDAVFPPAKMVVAPWQAEFSTLLAVWSRLLPFSFIASPNTLVAPTEIAEYTVTFPAFRDSHLRIPHFMLLFWDASQGDVPPSIDRILRDDEKGDTSTSARRIKRKAIHIFQAFQYVRDTRTASFWSRSDLIRAMKEGKWLVYIWRTDDWTRVTQGVDVKDVTQKGLWTE